MSSAFDLSGEVLKHGKPPSRRKILRGLVNRVTNGFSQAEFDLASSLGHEGYVEDLRDHLAIDYAVTDALLAPLDSLPKA